MERLTERERNIDGTGVAKEEITDGLLKPFAEKILTKLADYEDLEEQRLLVRLPIPLKTTVYTIYTKQWCYYDDNCMEDIEYKCMNGEFCENQKVRHYLHTEKFSVPMINFINKTVFLTREEAENRLKELENE